MNGRCTLPIKIQIYPYLLDHRLEGKAVYPAAEVIHTLSETVREACPDVSISYSRDAEFLRFLSLPEKVLGIDAVVELTPEDAGQTTALLLCE